MIDPAQLPSVLSKIPLKPGVYLMIDSLDKVIYVGKSGVLRKRVKSYFSGKTRDSKTNFLKKAVSEIRFIVTANEIEALVLENNLIKRHKPRFNVLLKDGKTHPYLLLTLSEPFPRLLKTRKVKFKDGNKYYGPLPDSKSLRFIIELLSKTFKLCTCKTPINPRKLPRRPCLRFHVGLCLGPCTSTFSKVEYQISVEKVVSFLSGTQTPNIGSLQDEMEKLAGEFRFEEAAELRDTMEGLKNFFITQRMEFLKPVECDLWGVAQSPDRFVASVFFIRGSKLLGNRTIETDAEPAASLGQMLSTLMTRFYEDNLIPLKIFSNHPPVPNAILVEYLSKRAGKSVRCGVPRGKELQQLLKLADENAMEILTNLKSGDGERISDGLINLEQALLLPKTPMRIECIDISHVQGTNPVASLVVAINGLPRRSEYRLFHIKDAPGNNDVSAIREITRRRFSRLRLEGESFPDLFIVDGGIGQATGAQQELDSLKVDCPVWGLAKREEILFSPTGTSIKLPFSNPARKILIKLRNEA
ncbi:excinuclease ABC subunit UvrC, partial [bacterium]|nr:excinuclease ABC subunit UvrC [bacterium]